jgi:hypothetical protein
MKKAKLIAFAAIFLVGLFGCQADLNDLNSVSVVDNIIGTWHAVRYEGDITTDYQVEIAKSSVADSVIEISNFFNNDATAKAYVNNLEIVLPQQVVGGVNIQGTGTISDDYQKISWTVTADGSTVTIIMSPGTVTKLLELAR